MKKTMRAAMMTSLRKIELEKKEVPSPKDNEVLIKVDYVGICGSDIHYFEEGKIGDFIVEYPFVLGHECAGTVIQAGKDVKKLEPGNRVALEPNKTCGHCEFCKSGEYNLCPEVKFFATPPYNGVFLEYVVYPEDLCFKLPEEVGQKEGSLIEPLAVGLYAAEKGGSALGQKALVIGAGCIGLVTLLALKARGVTEVFVSDLVGKRLEKAKELGATAVIKGNDEDILKEYTKGKGVDLVVDTVGIDKTLNQAINVAKKGATIVLVGYSPCGKVTIPASVMINKELTITSTFRYRNNYSKAIDAVASGNISINEIVTNEYTLDEIQEAMVACSKDKENIIKAIIKIN